VKVKSAKPQTGVMWAKPSPVAEKQTWIRKKETSNKQPKIQSHLTVSLKWSVWSRVMAF